MRPWRGCARPWRRSASDRWNSSFMTDGCCRSIARRSCASIPRARPGPLMAARVRVLLHDSLPCADRTTGSLALEEAKEMKTRIRIPAAVAAVVAVVGGAGPGSGAVAHAAEVKGPTLYGQLHVSLDHLDNGDDSALNLSSNRSRLGVKGEI